MKIRTVGAEFFHAAPTDSHDKAPKNFNFFPVKEYILCLHIPLPFMSKSDPNVTKREMCWFNKNLFSDKILTISNFHSLELNKMQHHYVVSCAVPVGNVPWIYFQEGRSSNFG